MNKLEKVLERVTEARKEIQRQQDLAKFGGPVNRDELCWLAGQNRAFGHVQLWLQEELGKDEDKQARLPGEI